MSAGEPNPTPNPTPVPNSAAAGERTRQAELQIAAEQSRERRGQLALAWSGWVAAGLVGLVGVWAYASWPEPPEPVTDPGWREAYERGLRDGRISHGGANDAAAWRNRLLAGAAAKAVTFVGAKKTVSGNVIWSDENQTGVLEVRGLPPIDPKAGVYQLWIVDGGRTDPNHKQPVDGGVFWVEPDGTALVLVRAAVHVRNAVSFAITKESDQFGVVVSDAEQVLVLTPKKE